MKKVLSNIEEYLCAGCLAVMTLLTVINVVARYVFSASFSFSEELTTYLFVLLSLMGTAIAAKRGAHLGFTLLSDLAPFKLRKVLRVIGYLFAVVFCLLLLYFGGQMVVSQFTRGQVTAGMQWPEWIFGAFVPLGAFFSALRFGQLLVKSAREKEAC